jgi:short-subunit dehydrogenase
MDTMAKTVNAGRTPLLPVEQLRAIPLFAGCTTEELADIATSLQPMSVDAGSTIFRERDPGNDMYIVAAGAVRIYSEARAQQTLAELGPGEFFGEMAVITGLPRSATAVARSDVQLWRLHRERFDQIVREHPLLTLEMVRVLAGRVQRVEPVGRNLAGRTALVTGASKGLGVHVARALAREKMNVVLTARSADRLEEVRRDIEALGVRAITVAADVANPADLQALLVRSISEFGSIDLLVNNAGMLLTLAYHKVYPQEIEHLVRINLTGPMFLSWLVLPGMLERGSGHVVNIASIAGKYGPAYNELYSSTKAALIAFTQSFRASYRDSGVSASVVCPGFIETGMYERSRRHGLRAPRLLGSTTPEAVAKAVVRSVKKDLPDVVVNAGPIRLFLALPTLFPGIAEWGRRRMGTDDLYRKAAEIRAQRRAETGR